jgi:hypothetical protein
MKDFIKLIYTLFIGGSIAIFSILTVSTAYPGPTFPEPNFSLSADATLEQQQDDERLFKQYENNSAEHRTNTSKIILASSVAIFILGLVAIRISRFNSVIVEGVLFGGLFTAVYSAIYNNMSFYVYSQPDHSQLVTLAASATSVIMILVITQLRFGLTNDKKSKRKK